MMRTQEQFQAIVNDQIKAVALSNKTDMLDTEEVERVAWEMNFPELLEFVQDHKYEYIAYILDKKKDTGMKVKRIEPAKIFECEPCSTVAVGCAKGITRYSQVLDLYSSELHDDGYLSLKGMNALARKNLSVKRYKQYRRGERPTLAEWARLNTERAIICVQGHYIYYDGNNYYSFFNNEDDEVIAVWYLK